MMLVVERGGTQVSPGLMEADDESFEDAGGEGG